MTDEPIRIDYKRWRHKDRGYIVTLVSVLNYKGKHGYLTSVTVQQKGASRPAVWPGETFVRTFEPAGRRIRRLTRWQRLGTV